MKAARLARVRVVMVRAALVLVFVIACGPAPRHGSSGPGGAATDGSEGAVCAWGSRDGESHPDTPLAACKAGLSCCYPCGIDGCSSVCATAQQCKDWATLP